MNLFRIPKPIRKARRKPRPGRLKGVALAELRIQCFARDRALCRDCGRFVIFDAPSEWDNSYHMAHIKAKRIGLDILSNVKVSCGKCHRAHHSGGKPVPPKVKL
jgi:5-methylcytosine-specific restriction endonuclease McrA